MAGPKSRISIFGPSPTNFVFIQQGSSLPQAALQDVQMSICVTGGHVLPRTDLLQNVFRGRVGMCTKSQTGSVRWQLPGFMTQKCRIAKQEKSIATVTVAIAGLLGHDAVSCRALKNYGRLHCQLTSAVNM